MRVINQGGYLHDHITALRLEEDCRHTGRREVFHRIWGYDADKGYEFILDWGIDSEQVRMAYEKMSDHLRSGSEEVWNVFRSGLIKEMEESA